MNNNRQIIKFIITAFSVYICWFIVYDYFIEPDGRLNAWLNILLARSGCLMLRIIGYQSAIAIKSNVLLMQINSKDMLAVGNACNGLELFILFAGFILCFPGSYKNKLWFIPLGICAIELINTIRAAVLALNQYYYPQSLQFNHHYTFTMIVYAFIFYLWFLWVSRFAKQSHKVNTVGLTEDATSVH